MKAQGDRGAGAGGRDHGAVGRGGRLWSVRRYDVAAPAGELWAALQRVGAFCDWWPWLRAFDGRALAAGEVWRCRIRPPAPYRLAVDVTIVSVEAPRSIGARIGGDVVGTASVSLRPSPGQGAAACELEVRASLAATRPLLRAVCALFPASAARVHGAVVDRAVGQLAAGALGVGAELVGGQRPRARVLSRRSRRSAASPR